MTLLKKKKAAGSAGGRCKHYCFGVGAGVGEGAGVAAVAGVFSGAAAGGGTLSGAGGFSLIDINSTSKISVEFGPMGPPGVPRGP